MGRIHLLGVGIMMFCIIACDLFDHAFCLELGRWCRLWFVEGVDQHQYGSCADR